MRSYLLILALVLGAACRGHAQDPHAATGMAPSTLRDAEKPRVVDPEIARLRFKLNPEFQAWSPGYVIERAAEHLAVARSRLVEEIQARYHRKLCPADESMIYAELSRIRFFDLSDLPRQLLPAGTSGLFFGVNSASRATIVHVPKPVANTDNRLYWIDLCWYEWTPEAWESVSKEDFYFREPLVPSGPALNFLKYYCGNGVVRADWFLYYTYDTTQFLKAGVLAADNAFYYQLLYAQVGFLRGGKQSGGKSGEPVDKKKVFGVPPQTAKEFEQAWKVDFAVLQEFPIDKGAMVDEGDSGVSYQNRVLWRVPGAVGTYWRTFDVFRSVGDQDYTENPFPGEFDAGEHIFQDAKGAQFYLLTNGKGQRVEFGDPRAVRDQVSGEKLIVLTSKSCVACHQDGIIRPANEQVKIRDAEVRLRAVTPNKAERLRQFYLQDLNRYVAQDQANYTEFVKNCNGLTTGENNTQFSKIRNWYAGPISFPQAARELGAETQELSDAIGYQATKGRIGRLVMDGKPIPRAVWERGDYQETFLLLLEYRKKKKLYSSSSGVEAPGSTQGKDSRS